MREQIIAIMKRVFKLENLPDNLSQQTVQAWDSLRHLNLIIELEMEFNVEFTPEEIAAMKTLSVIEQKLSEKLG